ncbi:MAG: family 78 glycoside hydrolase catalytic domain [Anaerolineae bacterium]|nr:family 78 glycoside hydrolase catalytic domain [Anaerolineae bacterium]
MPMSTETFSSGAVWIWAEPTAALHNDWRYFRHRWTAPVNIRRATLLITADSRYEVSLNGTHIGRGPVRSFPYAYAYDVYDITASVQAGAENVIAALVNAYGDHSMVYILAGAGLLCEIILEDNSGKIMRVGSGSDWKTTPCEAFNAQAPRISVQLGFEEQIDGRREIVDWDSLDLDDAGWSPAVNVGSAGTAPWTNLTPSSIPFLTEDLTPPVAIKAVELARTRPGMIWNLDLRTQLNTMRNGLRSAPPGERGSILFTEITAPKACDIRIHMFPNYEPIIIRVNDSTYGDANSPLDNPEAPIPVHLNQGANLFMVKTVEWPSFLFETSEQLTYSAERFAKGAAWGLISPLNELQGEVEALWLVDSLDDLVRNKSVIAIPASANKTDIFGLTSSQEFLAVPGGFCTHDITRATPRKSVNGAGRAVPADAPNALLHDNGQWTTINPQPDGDVHVVIDFGRETIGYVQIDMDAPEGAIIDGNFFEGIDDGGIFWTRNLRNSFRYVCREGHQVFTSHERRGFRYGSFTFRNLSRPLKIRHITHKMATYPVEAKGSFHSSDETLNKIWEVGAYTVRLCMLDTYVDCPAYEQVYWVGDARNSALVNGIAFGAYDLTDRCVRLTGESLSQEIKMVIPPHIQAMRTHITSSHVVSGWFDEIPMWTFLWIWMAWEQYMNTGDKQALVDYYAYVKECLIRCETFLTERDLFDVPDVWNLVDWAAQDLERDGEVISNTALMAQALDYASWMAEALGHADDKAHHEAIAKRLRDAVNKYGWSDEYQCYVDTVRDQTAYEYHQKLSAKRGVTPDTWEVFHNKQRISEPTNTLVLLCNTVPAERRDAVMKLVLNAKDGKFIGSSPWYASAGKPDEMVPVGSPWFLFFTLETLFQEGLSTDALTILREQWNRMLEKGATSFWETFPGHIGSGHWSRSLCHGWSAAPAYFLTTQVLGVKPAEPGYSRIRIAPQPFNLTWAEGVVPTPRGPVTVSWKLNESGQLDVQYDAPQGCEVEVVLPERV